MDNDTLRRVQMIQLDIALEVDRVCNKLGINYFLDSGTLLGAVRHKGFIPWDDDLDLGMLRNDYDIFIERCQSELGDKYYLQTWVTDPKYPNAFAKIRRRNSIYVEEAASDDAECGIYVDIFPYDVFPDDPKKRKWQRPRYFLYRRLLLSKCGYRPWLMNVNNKRESSIKKLFYISLKVVSLFISKEALIHQYMKFCTRFNTEQSKYLYAQGGASDYGKWIVPSDSFKSFVKLDFEGYKLSAPTGYDAYLTKVYNDYMKLPPEDKRINRHRITRIVFPND